ncbi:MAG: transglutaminase domain-containing protein [bacterium]
MLEAVTQCNITWLHRHPETPLLYKSHVRYEPEEGEIFQDIPTTLRKGHGDCDCLSTYRCAELRKAGINCRPYIKWRKNMEECSKEKRSWRDNDGWIYHALVWWPGNRIEDPSVALGMHGVMHRKPMFVSPE